MYEEYIPQAINLTETFYIIFMTESILRCFNKSHTLYLEA